MQSKDEIEKEYQTPDPWGFQTHPDDAARKQIILNALTLGANKPMRFKRALDIGAGEGWITKDLPADEIFGFEISDTAASRFPANVKRVLEPEGMYDLIIATGVLYGHYDYRRFINMILGHASGTIVLCNVAAWEVPEVQMLGVPMFDIKFPYREFQERLRVYDFAT